MSKIDSDSENQSLNPAAKWGSWQAMRFLYEDVNSKLFGLGLDLSPFNLDIPAVHLPNYFNSFKTLQGRGSTSAGTGVSSSGGGAGGGAVVVLLCNISELVNKPRQEFVNYIIKQGEFSLKMQSQAISSAMKSGINATPVYGNTVTIASGIETQFSVDLCPPPACSKIRNLSLVFRVRAAVYAQAAFAGDQCPLVAWRNFMSYKLQADYGLGNSFFSEKDPYVADPPLSGSAPSWGGGYYTCSGSSIIDPIVDPNTIFSEVSKQVYYETMTLRPTLPDKLSELLSLSGC